jgi:hypothetical protein
MVRHHPSLDPHTTGVLTMGIPKFSDDPEQDAEMRAQYFFECRIQGINPYDDGERDYDEPGEDCGPEDGDE